MLHVIQLSCRQSLHSDSTRAMFGHSFCHAYTSNREVLTARHARYGLCHMQGTELNPDFFLDIVAAVSKDLGALLLCNIGGKIDVTETNPAGTQSR